MTTTKDAFYILGSSPEEQQRLIDQSAVMGEFTERWLQNAGLAPGMRVLDLGCGVGDVSFLAARLVGKGGRVVGVDRDQNSIDKARHRAAQGQYPNVSFVSGDLRNQHFDEYFDAIIGRFVLMYVADPAAVLRSLLPYLRPEGIVAFQEFDYQSHYAYPPSPLWETLTGWWSETAKRAGVEMTMGTKLHAMFREAGLPSPQVAMDTRLVGGDDITPYRYIANTIRNIIPAMERFGVATREEVGIETLAERLRAEVVSGNGVIGIFPIVSAWTRYLP